MGETDHESAGNMARCTTSALNRVNPYGFAEATMAPGKVFSMDPTGPPIYDNDSWAASAIVRGIVSA